MLVRPAGRLSVGCLLSLCSANSFVDEERDTRVYTQIEFNNKIQRRIECVSK